MKAHCYHLLFLFALMLPSSAVFPVVYVVHPNYPISDVSEWTERTLMSTLSAGYHEHTSEAANVRRHFLPTAWRPMQAFFRDKLVIVNQKHLVLHPQPLSPTTVVIRDCEATSCWRVHQAFLIPELRTKIDFNVLVVTADPAHGSPFLIQSMDIFLTDY